MNSASPGRIKRSSRPTQALRLSPLYLSLFFSSLSQAAEPQHPLILQASSEQTYYIQGQLAGGRPSMFLLDTGSSYTVINNASFTELQRNGKVQFLTELDGRLADGSRFLVPLYRVSTIILDGNCAVSDVEVAVFRDADRQILGLSTLRKLSPILLLTDPPGLKVSRCETVEPEPSRNAGDLPANEVALTERPHRETIASQTKVPKVKSGKFAGH